MNWRLTILRTVSFYGRLQVVQQLIIIIIIIIIIILIITILIIIIIILIIIVTYNKSACSKPGEKKIIIQNRTTKIIHQFQSPLNFYENSLECLMRCYH